MTISCAICRKNFTSLLIPPDKALAEIQPKIDTHLKTRHIAELQKILLPVQRITFLAAFYLATTQLLDFDESETYLAEIVQKHQDEIMHLLGFDKTAEITEESSDVPEDMEVDHGHSSGHETPTP